jgi:hypothetical protein
MASKRGAIPDSFVPAVFTPASPETHLALCLISPYSAGSSTGRSA